MKNEIRNDDSFFEKRFFEYELNLFWHGLQNETIV